jgi:hypothetical protein
MTKISLAIQPSMCKKTIFTLKSPTGLTLPSLSKGEGNYSLLIFNAVYNSADFIFICIALTFPSL